MPSKIVDAEDDASDESDASEQASTKSVAVDWSSKYKGEQKRADKLAKKLADVEVKLAELEANSAEEAGTERIKASDAAKALKELQKTHESVLAEKARLEGEVTNYKTAQGTAATIAKDFPNLTELWAAGDLRGPGEFKTPEEFTAYLDRMASRLGAPEKAAATPPAKDTKAAAEKAAGSTPAFGARKSDSGSKRTRTQIVDEMMKVDERIDPGAYEKLEIELLTVPE